MSNPSAVVHPVNAPIAVTVGKQGPIGPGSSVPGPKGDEGDPGPEGDSAYQLAVLNGFIGTQQDWLDSLVGPPGAAGAAPQSYSHSQSPASADWLVNHNLGYNPGGITVIDSGGTPWEGVVEYIDANNLMIHFTTAFGGTAQVS